MGIVSSSDSLAVMEGSKTTEITNGTDNEDALIVWPVDGRDTVEEFIHSYYISHSLQTMFEESVQAWTTIEDTQNLNISDADTQTNLTKSKWWTV